MSAKSMSSLQIGLYDCDLMVYIGFQPKTQIFTFQFCVAGNFGYRLFSFRRIKHTHNTRKCSLPPLIQFVNLIVSFRLAFYFYLFSYFWFGWWIERQAMEIIGVAEGRLYFYFTGHLVSFINCVRAKYFLTSFFSRNGVYWYYICLFAFLHSCR